MEDPIQFDMGDSSLFGDSKPKEMVSEDVFEMGDSLLFHPEESTSSDGKKIKLSDGTFTTMKLRQRKPPVFDEQGLSSESMNFVDMDALFRKAEQREAFRQNQRQLNEQIEKVHKPTTVWTEKYRPKRFIDLCSGGNDKQYRLISHWLKKWSSVVHDEPSLTEDETVDSLGRPLKKVLLISGPSGIGKTASVHLIAKQLGYSVEELNAANSMDALPNSNSSSSTYGNVFNSLKLKIQNALTSNSIQTEGNKIVANGKPTCLVIDEIDTAPNSGDIIRVLNDIIMSDQRAMNKTHNNDKYDSDVKKKNKKSQLLSRPIICIANDIYSSSLRTYGGFNMDKLRSMSEVVSFQKPSMQKTNSGAKTGGKAITSVKEHLKWISGEENLKLDYQQISEIVEICEGDIRAAINHLQFNGREINTTLLSLDKSNKNIKDAQLSWFKLTDMLFKRDAQLSKEKDFESLMEVVLNGSGKSAASSTSTLDKVVRACFNRYLDSVYHQDDSLTKPCELSDWLDFYDRSGNISDATDYSSLVSLKFWLLFSEINPRKSSKPLIPDIKNIEFQSMETKKVNKSIIKKFIEKVPISLSLSLGGGFENNESFGLFVLPMIYKIISPDMVSSGSSSSLSMKQKSSLNEFDQRCLEKAAQVTKAFGINLETLRDMNTNQVSLEISPNLDSLVFFNTELNDNNYESICKQIQLKRRWFFPLLQSELDRADMFKRVEKRKPEEDLDKTKKKQKMSSSLEFFKGQYDGIATQIQQPKDKGDSEAHRIWVKYNEGFSNAVRKNIGWKELWQI